MHCDHNKDSSAFHNAIKAKSGRTILGPATHFVRMNKNMLCFVFLFVIPVVKGTVPGTFFWKPRLGIDLNIPPTSKDLSEIHLPTKENVREGLVVLVEGYQVGMTVIAFAAGIGSVEPFIHLNPLSAYYYTNAYRWTLRYISMIPFWMSGHWGNYCETHKVWLRRFYYMDQFVPPWMRNLFPYVDNNEWKKEEKEFNRFKKYAEPAFGKHYRFPTKKFNDFRSELTKETLEGLDESSNSLS